MRILVTGANGYLGTGVVEELFNLHHEVIATDFVCDKIPYNIKRIEANIFDVEDPFSFFGKPDVLLHMAWRNGFVHDSETHIEDLSKHYLFIKRMAESGVKTIAVMGTMHEIGFYEGKVDENTPCNPSTLYGISKNALRQATQKVCSINNVNFLWLRAFYIVGNPKMGNSIFSKIYKAYYNGANSFPMNSGTNRYDFIEYDDFCKQVSFSCTQSKITGIINICSGKAVSLLDKVKQFMIQNKCELNLDIGAFEDRPYDSKCIYGDNSKIMSILNK